VGVVVREDKEVEILPLLAEREGMKVGLFYVP
jgi:hypothetical protein